MAEISVTPKIVCSLATPGNTSLGLAVITFITVSGGRNVQGVNSCIAAFNRLCSHFLMLLHPGPQKSMSFLASSHLPKDATRSHIRCFVSACLSWLLFAHACAAATFVFASCSSGSFLIVTGAARYPKLKTHRPSEDVTTGMCFHTFSAGPVRAVTSPVWTWATYTLMGWSG